MSSPGVCWSSLHRWKVELELVGLEPESGVNRGFSYAQWLSLPLGGRVGAGGPEEETSASWLCDGILSLGLGCESENHSVVSMEFSRPEYWSG